MVSGHDIVSVNYKPNGCYFQDVRTKTNDGEFMFTVVISLLNTPECVNKLKLVTLQNVLDRKVLLQI